MNALSRLLTRVACRVMRNNPTNDTLLSTADRVITWRNADYIDDAQVDEITAAMPEEPTEEPAQTEPVDSTATKESTLADMTKAELLALAAERGIEAYESWTKAEIIAALEA